MLARVAVFEGGDPAQARETLADINERSASGPPEGVPAVGLLALHSTDKVLVISLFDNEDDLRQGHETLSSMEPPVPGAMGKRTAVELYEVAVKRDDPGS